MFLLSSLQGKLLSALFTTKSGSFTNVGRTLDFDVLFSLELEDSRGRESGGIIHSSPSFSSWYFLYLLLVPCFFDAVTSLQCSLSPNVLCLLYSQSVDVLNPNVVDRWILSHGLSGQQTLCKKDTDSHHPGPVMAIRSSIAHSLLLPVVTCCCHGCSMSQLSLEGFPLHL